MVYGVAFKITAHSPWMLKERTFPTRAKAAEFMGWLMDSMEYARAKIIFFESE